MEFFFYFHFFTESVCFFNRHYAKLKKIRKLKQKLTPQNCPISTSCAPDFPASRFLLLAADGDLPTPEELFSLKFPDWLKQKDLRICCLKTFPDCFSMTAAGRFRPSSPRWMSWGIMSNGLCLTAPILVSPSLAGGCSLSDILMPDAQEKYYLSSAQMERLLSKSSEGIRADVSTTPQVPPVP